MSEKRQPWGKWYWGDWRKDARLRRCTYAARGLWADMLSLMGGECERFGALIMDGQPLAADDLVSMLGGSEREIEKLLGELEAKRVFNRIGDADIPEDVAAMIGDALPIGTIISRRMIRDKAKADQDRENGKGGGNPNLKPPRKPGKPNEDNEGVNPQDKAQMPDARCQSSEAKASAPSGAADPVKDLFDSGERILTTLGVKPKSARALVGQCRKEFHDDGKVFSLLLEIERQRIRAPEAYIEAAILKHKSPGGVERPFG